MSRESASSMRTTVRAWCPTLMPRARRPSSTNVGAAAQPSRHQLHDLPSATSCNRGNTRMGADGCGNRRRIWRGGCRDGCPPIRFPAIEAWYGRHQRATPQGWMAAAGAAPRRSSGLASRRAEHVRQRQIECAARLDSSVAQLGTLFANRRGTLGLDRPSPNASTHSLPTAAPWPRLCRQRFPAADSGPGATESSQRRSPLSAMPISTGPFRLAAEPWP